MVDEKTNLVTEDDTKDGFLLMAKNESDEDNDSVWYLDTGASNHMSGNEYLFHDLIDVQDGLVSFGDASKVAVKGKLTVCFLSKDGFEGKIENVYFVLDLKSNFLSLGQLMEKGYTVLMKGRVLHLNDRRERPVIQVQMGKNKMYKVNLRSV